MMDAKFIDLLDRLFGKLESDLTKIEKAIDDLKQKHHRHDIEIKKIAMLPKKTCTGRFEQLEDKADQIKELEGFHKTTNDKIKDIFSKLIKINEELEGIKKALPNEREIARAKEDEKETKKSLSDIKKKTDSVSNRIWFYGAWGGGFLFAVGLAYKFIWPLLTK